jgi:hypothetical protein
MSTIAIVLATADPIRRPRWYRTFSNRQGAIPRSSLCTASYGRLSWLQCTVWRARIATGHSAISTSLLNTSHAGHRSQRGQSTTTFKRAAIQSPPPEHIVQLSPPMTAPPVTEHPRTAPSHSRRYSCPRSPEIVRTGSCGPSCSPPSQQVLVLFSVSSNRGARKGSSWQP